MKDKVTILALFIFFIGAIAYSKADFTVFAAKGELNVQKSGKTKWEKLSTGQKLNPTDNIKVGSNSYLSLLHFSGRAIEIRESGVYSVNKLSSAVQNKKAALSARITNYIMNEIKNSDDLLAKSNYHDNMAVTGAVERSGVTGTSDWESMVEGKVVKITLIGPAKMNVKNDKIQCTWSASTDLTSYKFVLTDRFDKPVFNQTVQGNSIVLESENLKLDKDVYYFWYVTSSANEKIKSDKACFLVMSQNKIKIFDESLANLKNELDGETAVNQIVLANFYEQNSMIQEADNHYQKALELQPDVQEYINIYRIFKIKNNFSGK